MVVRGFSLGGSAAVPDVDGCAVLKNGNPEGGVKIHYSRIQLDEPLKLDFSVPSKYKRITFAQVLKTITNLNQ